MADILWDATIDHHQRINLKVRFEECPVLRDLKYELKATAKQKNNAPINVMPAGGGGARA